jgi:transcriptional regulator with XRE-family HTH domain
MGLSCIKNLREAHKLSQKELADKLGVERSMIAMIENGTRKPSLELLYKLRKAYDLKNEWLGECIVEYVEQKKIVSTDN